MPKGKAKKYNPSLYEDTQQAKQSRMASQAVTHKRGGTHRVRDEDQTGSVYDTFNYKELVAATKQRKIYVKDMKKREMAQALQKHDDDERRRERNALLKRQRLAKEEKKAEQQKKAEKEARSTAKEQRKIARLVRRDHGDEDVSDDSEEITDEEERIEAEHNRLIDLEYACEDIGHVLSDESWDSTSSESDAESTIAIIAPDCRLRLYDWTYRFSPLREPHTSKLIPSEKYFPVQSRYAPLKIVTTETNQKLILPGQMYPPGVEPDFVPVLSPRTRTAARNGVLKGVLCNATIERALYWGERTLIQGWNGRMYFQLPPRDDTKSLAEVYEKWNMEDRKLLKVKGRGDGIRADRERRHVQRHRNKARRIVEVYDASEYRPMYICYVPAYLDYGECQQGGESVGQRSLENLFYIRFPSCDVPHYYFWAREGEWTDPIAHDISWRDQRAPQRTTIDSTKGMQHNCLPFEKVPQSASRYSNTTWKTPYKKQVRVKSSSINSFPPEASDYSATIAKVEQQLYIEGLQTTLSRYRSRWIAHGKKHVWKVFARFLPALYPSGNFPKAPPVDAYDGADIATKITMIELLDADGDMPCSPLVGREAWTRNDDVFWDTLDANTPAVFAYTEEDIQAELHRSADLDDGIEILCHSQSPTRARKWSVAAPADGSWSERLTSYILDEAEEAEWEDKYFQHHGGKANPVCAFRDVERTEMAFELQA